MQIKKLGWSSLEVSKLCLGSMTWGEQTTPEDGWRQIDTALAHGINFIDTAEMYPTNPMRAETSGDTERVIGKWPGIKNRRDELVIATKVTGAGHQFVREGSPISPQTIRSAVEASLQSMNTDYIDIYQLHWPNRGSYMFRKNWQFNPTGQDRAAFTDHVDEVLTELDSLVKAGKIRYFGLSNESAWGTSTWLQAAKTTERPRVLTIQNEYSLLCRLFDLDLAELCHHEQVDLLAFSPLAAGLLTGKYQGGSTTPDGSRMAATPDLGGRKTARVWPAIHAYLTIARKYGLDPVHMALSWAMMRPFMGSVIFGATTQTQLEHILAGADLVLSDEVVAEIDAAHKAHPMPF
ncbi:putative oxidoreductase, aryl-alcohol dehydrogenase like protein [SAR116 cluster alpha proteobacterium HIMB100]|nr:putative oxidoreductase, aryl-alcohol dehydrogenase like protein [SAR116 cluster alpha proteobacterium HIMB100]